MSVGAREDAADTEVDGAVEDVGDACAALPSPSTPSTDDDDDSTGDSAVGSAVFAGDDSSVDFGASMDFFFDGDGFSERFGCACTNALKLGRPWGRGSSKGIA